jgi:hypothetical protein
MNAKNIAGDSGMWVIGHDDNIRNRSTDGDDSVLFSFEALTPHQ